MRHTHAIARRVFLSWLTATASASAFAQAKPKAAQSELIGRTADGQAITLQQLRGRVVLVFYWSTECPVCRNKMPELRANTAGWHGKEFTLLGVNMDAKKAEFLRYEEVVSPLLPTNEKFSSVWGLDPSYKDNLGPVQHLPSAVLIDKEGQVVERYSGRIPAQAWDRIADLL